MDLLSCNCWLCSDTSFVGLILSASEQRRRADVKSGIQELRKVMDVANNLPKSLSQTKILSKVSTSCVFGSFCCLWLWNCMFL